VMKSTKNTFVILASMIITTRIANAFVMLAFINAKTAMTLQMIADTQLWKSARWKIEQKSI